MYTGVQCIVSTRLLKAGTGARKISEQFRSALKSVVLANQQ
jgi:hypothetical protein